MEERELPALLVREQYKEARCTGTVEHYVRWNCAVALIRSEEVTVYVAYY